MSKHTPAPWVADNNEGFSSWLIWAGMSPTGHEQAGHRVADVLGDSTESDANACLIAAAPELLEALVKAFRVMQAETFSMSRLDADLADAMHVARVTIAKAKGEQP